MADAARYPWTIDVVVRDDDFDGIGHVGNVAVVRLLAESRLQWLVTLEGRPPGHAYVVRHLVVDYVGEGLPGAKFRGGVRATRRGRTSLTLDQTLWADDRVMATATAVHVAFHTDGRRPVELWPEVVASIEARQGARLPAG